MRGARLLPTDLLAIVARSLYGCADGFDDLLGFSREESNAGNAEQSLCTEERRVPLNFWCSTAMCM